MKDSLERERRALYESHILIGRHPGPTQAHIHIYGCKSHGARQKTGSDIQVI